ncbi:hypothetical protein PUNSTDRAFT_130486 [Punctularia strigosozonata HHB-11173 SS5]|uniref:uncharacterized protein n=1 Tax=Punctularia strigosozonata (strain HHB-11173) TaxID=741275 RepID=UPI00044165E4|nr:uncharacterized protein PUNSTDRAFT_130486 [Punctularia strigosozonata HHB-11173 SS5]EIN12216.1 hypothetical protein PUNSTDRAFT_130486 [Punctularia strigosozonata HHB-11173 SS5]
MIVSDHSLAIERLRWAERYHPKVPREWRLCRFCEAAIEDPGHILHCGASPELCDLRTSFLATVCTIRPSLNAMLREPGDFLMWATADQACVDYVGQFLRNALRIFDAAPPFYPAHITHPLPSPPTVGTLHGGVEVGEGEDSSDDEVDPIAEAEE